EVSDTDTEPEGAEMLSDETEVQEDGVDEDLSPQSDEDPSDEKLDPEETVDVPAGAAVSAAAESEEARATTVMNTYVESTKAEKGCLWYAWDRAGNKLFCNEAYEDAQAVLAHMKNLEKLGDFNGAAKLTQIEFHGQSVELEKLRTTATAVNARLFTEDQGASFMHPVSGAEACTPSTLCTVHAYYDLMDENKAEPVLADLAAKTKTERGCLYYGWTKAGDTLFCREGYLDSAAVLAHLSNVQSFDGLSNCATLRRLELHGPAAEIAKLRQVAQEMKAECFERVSGFQRLELDSAVKASAVGGVVLDPAVLRDFCSIHAYYKVSNEEAAKGLIKSFEARTKAEKGCLWYAWDRAEEKFFCNEAYVNAEAVLAHVQHLEGVGSFDGAAKLTEIEFHGPAAELEKVMGTAKKLGASLFALESDVNFRLVDFCSEGKPADLCTIHAYYKVTDESGVNDALAELVKLSRAEESCIYYGWTRAGSKLFCREGYTSADAILAHLENVSACCDLTKCAKPYRIEFHAPKAEIAKLQGTADKMGAFCFSRQSGFQHFRAKTSAPSRPLPLRSSGDGMEHLKKQFLRVAVVLKYMGLAGHMLEIFLALLGKLAKRRLTTFPRMNLLASLMIVLGLLAERPARLARLQ
ncbi:unnamed protein product, partial [Symbiodinium necroappetens]